MTLTRTQKILWGALIMTEAVKPEELEAFGLSEELAKNYALHVSQIIQQTKKSKDKSKQGKIIINLVGSKLFGILSDDPKETILL
ncbi:hypothetical protein [Pseudoalteromonas phenolica]|uniref:Uncharacterized protein n=1 Tax=Pseudoalteromonas phenolica TaxID=161398 RepID=A0A0S2K393_9GAMM|nr:hypothetical protein [Pseudoalteromonas phenolica]ALO42517.1 hypothetical protein PP2015_2019 [Pseudoalteromonas phenolica]MBE0356383.1 hypothetical protein [Pseudoalteromonas phenolica O-BC30]